MIFTFEELKTFLPSFVSEENEALALHFLSVAETEVENRTGRLLTQATRSVTDTVRGRSSYIKYFPFFNLEIRKDGEILIEDEDYILDPDTGRIYFLPQYVKKEITVSYNAGYASAAAVPPPLKQAVLDIITWMLRRHEKAGVTTSDYGNIEITAENRMPLAVLDLILQYKVFDLGGQRW